MLRLLGRATWVTGAVTLESGPRFLAYQATTTLHLVRLCVLETGGLPLKLGKSEWRRRVYSSDPDHVIT